MKNKLVKKVMPLLFISFFNLISCANYSNQFYLNSLVSNDDSVASPSTNNEKNIHNSIINNLLSMAFKNNQEKILDYKNSQNKNSKSLFNQYNNISKLFFASENKKEFAQQQQDFFTKNWYFILNNLDKFQFNFVEFVTSDLSKNYSTSEEYKQKVKIKELNNKYEPFTFENTYLESLREGVESAELGDSLVYYIRKNKLVFRVLINNLRAQGNEPEVLLKPLNWNFSESKANIISPLLISNVVHQLFIHNYPSGKDEFEIEMVEKQKYGSPVFVFPTLKE
ncbi:aromatic motif membrane protein [Mesomycoplasma molare]|uniref:Lipoprotein n=1 Tax=Mesomycoplasma molare TaxID=171288 RepID=A0ABY5TVA9_9BACT|nr:aromatic motif membrane protein [Mesomycoplasma molare]UWD34577.1 hypothetical protein NX772_01980 [Mesomycoplasma molare]